MTRLANPPQSGGSGSWTQPRSNVEVDQFCMLLEHCGTQAVDGGKVEPAKINMPGCFCRFVYIFESRGGNDVAFDARS